MFCFILKKDSSLSKFWILIMEIIDFFTNISLIIADGKPVICFTGETYQPIFLEKIKTFIEKHIGEPIQKFAPDQSLTDIQMRLGTTFLGQQQWFMVNNLESISVAKKKADFIQFIKNYSGPHRIIIFINKEDGELPVPHDQAYMIGHSYSNEQVKKIAILYEDSKPEILAYFFNKLFAIKKEYSLDQLCLLKEYAGLLGNNIGHFFDDWIEKLVVSDVSLFYLSQLFFEKNESEFFIQWHKVRALYPDQFWTAFFSEHLFKGYFYVQHKGQVPLDQKQITFGLPFSFLKHDWKMYSGSELQVAHQKMYEIDLSLKRSGSSYQLDTFCMAFFNDDFV